jgi:superfamily I DNA/RNA helicase
MDFTDLLDRYIAEGRPATVKRAYIDEAQDLSRIQWEALQKFFSEVDELTIAGDDDQSIFKWSGADLGTFLSLAGEKTVLAHSYRLPLAIYNKAAAIVGRVKQRFSKPFTPAGDGGSVRYISSLDHLKIDPTVDTLILVRNVYLLKDVYEYLRLRGINFTGRSDYRAVDEDHVRAISTWESIRRGEAVPLDNVRNLYDFLRVGVVLSRGGKAALSRVDDKESEYFTWETLRDHYGLLDKPVWHKALLGIPLEKREFYISMLRRKQRLSGACSVHVNTIHGVKGGEADHVVVVSDMSKKTYEEMLKDPCSEHRVAYVAVTRSKKDLTIIMSQGKYSYAY